MNALGEQSVQLSNVADNGHVVVCRPFAEQKCAGGLLYVHVCALVCVLAVMRRENTESACTTCTYIDSRGMLLSARTSVFILPVNASNMLGFTGQQKRVIL